MAHDDGKRTKDIKFSDIILLGVSRTSKTPTSIYLANRGYKTTNIPLVLGQNVPNEIKSENFKGCVVGLYADPIRLSEIRRNRVAIMNEAKIAKFTDIKHIQDEVTNSIQLFKKNKCPIIDVTRKSV